TRDILAIQIAVVGPKRVFSASEDVVTNRRNRLKGDIIHDIMLTKYTYAEEDKEDIRLREEEGNRNNEEEEETIQKIKRLFFKDYISDDEERTDTEWLDEDYNSTNESNISHKI